MVSGDDGTLTCGARGATVVLAHASPTFTLVGAISEHHGLAGRSGFLIVP